MMFVDIIIYSILGWYFNNVAPREFGRPLPFYFLFTKSYWFGQNKTKINVNDRIEGEKYEENAVAGPGEIPFLGSAESSKVSLLGKEGNFEELNSDELHLVI